jgi:biopolymer transport protein ExbD
MEFKFKSRFQHRAQIDITSLIDLVFLLVAFFMVTSSLSTISSITVHLPKAVQVGVYKQGNLIITINEKNEVYINDVKYRLETLINEFKRRKSQIKDGMVVIRGDRKADYQTIVRVMDSLNRAGLPKFILSTVKTSDELNQ